MNRLTVITIALTASMATATAFAQQAAADASATSASEAPAATATVRVDQGKVMVSDGGAFTAVVTGAAIAPGQRLMLSEGAAATVMYSNHCKRKYSAPGVYVIEDASNCKAPVAGSNTGVAIGVAAGAAAIGVAAGGGGGDDNNDTPPPVSR